MFIPWNTDAPIYHGPWATIAMIVANILVFGALIADPELFESLMLTYGHVNPVQWLTGNFVHGDLTHLVGNMIFLWSFGLIVEGKIGWLAFLAAYLGIGVTQSGIEQLVTLALPDGGSFGASAIIFGLLAICVVWAPRNDLHCLFFIGLVPRTVEIPILAFGMIYIGWEILLQGIGGFSITSATLHLSGALVGFAVGIAMLKLDRVDCEGWDLFAVLAGREGERPVEKVHREKVDPAELLSEIRKCIALGDGAKAWGANERHTNTVRGWKLPEKEHLAIIQLLYKAEAWPACLTAMKDFVRRHPERCERIRLSLARLLLREQRPAQALQVLAKVDAGRLSPELQAILQKTVQSAERMRAQGVLELEAEEI